MRGGVNSGTGRRTRRETRDEIDGATVEPGTAPAVKMTVRVADTGVADELVLVVRAGEVLVSEPEPRALRARVEMCVAGPGGRTGRETEGAGHVDFDWVGECEESEGREVMGVADDHSEDALVEQEVPIFVKDEFVHVESVAVVGGGGGGGGARAGMVDDGEDEDETEVTSVVDEDDTSEDGSMLAVEVMAKASAHGLLSALIPGKILLLLELVACISARAVGEASGDGIGVGLGVASVLTPIGGILALEFARLESDPLPAGADAVS